MSNKVSFEELLREGESRAICQALVDLTFDPDSDFLWLERRCADLVRTYPNNDVRSLAATCLGHIAQFAGALSDESLEVLRAHKDDPSLHGNAENALEDWWMFVGRHK